MRIVVAIPLVMLASLPGFTRAEPAGMAPAAFADSNEARWADWEAQARITDGNYDGAIQAQEQANTDRREAKHQEMLARSAKH
jgi:hypothetical protein